MKTVKVYVPKMNVILIWLDGLRYDRLKRCPNLINFCRKNFFFSNMIASTPYTSSSFPSIFSATYSSVNGVNSYCAKLRFKRDKFKTLTKYLKDEGYFCYGDMPDYFKYTNTFHRREFFDENKVDLLERHKLLIQKISKRKNFFLFLDYSYIHRDLIKNVGKKYNDLDDAYFNNRELNEENYEKSLIALDNYVKIVIKTIKESELMHNSIIVLLSDHGASLGDRKGEKMYGCLLYDYTIRTFCTIYVPSKKGKEIASQVRTIDIMPTILGLLDIKKDNRYVDFQGKSLLPYMYENEGMERIAFSETGGLGGFHPSPKKHNLFCIRWKNHKIILNTTSKLFEFYNLENDPLEQNNLIDKKTKLVPIFKSKLLDQLEENRYWCGKVSMDMESIEVQIPKELYEKVEKKMLEETNFKSMPDYIIYILQKVVATIKHSELDNYFSKLEQIKVREDLIKSGYLE